MDTASENGNSVVANSGMIVLFVVIGSLAVLLFIVILVSCIRRQIRKRKRETVNMDILEVSSARFGTPLNRQRSISLIDITSHMEQRRKSGGSEFGSVQSRDSVDSITKFLPLSCEIPRQSIVDLDVEAKQNRTSTSIQKYMKSVGLVKDQVDVFEETEDEESSDGSRKGLKYKKTRPRSRSTDSQSKSFQVQSISLSDSEEEKRNHKGKSKRHEDSDTDTHVSKSSKYSKSSKMSKKSATTRHRVESSSEDEGGSSSNPEHKTKKPKHDNNDNTANQPSKKKKKHHKVRQEPVKRNLLQASVSIGSNSEV